MKKIKIQKRLELKKTTVARLQKENLKEVQGGAPRTWITTSCVACPN